MSDNELKGIFKHPFIDDIVAVSEVEGVEVRHADFNSGHVIVALKGQEMSFEGVVRSMRFIDLHDKMAIQKVDFETGEITVTWHPQGVEKVYMNLNVSKEEVEFLKLGKKINAIKECRRRTGLGLADAKRLIEAAQDELRTRGIIK